MRTVWLINDLEQQECSQAYWVLSGLLGSGITVGNLGRIGCRDWVSYWLRMRGIILKPWTSCPLLLDAWNEDPTYCFALCIYVVRRSGGGFPTAIVQ